ncbi:MAG: hypothetical protein ACJ76M_09185, partial [Solirubrobacteraceae bacterium]
FMFAFYPQFVPQDGPVLAWTAALAGLQVVLETGLYLGFAAAVGRASGWFRRPRIRRRLEALSGTVLVGQQLFAGEATRLAYMTDEAVEGRDAFLEKRDPDFTRFPWHV